MDPSQLLREARRYAGYSQRHLAAVSGLSERTVTEAETGVRRLSARSLDALLRACGLDLVLSPRTASDACQHVTDHLRLSTTVRLHLAVGGDGRDLGGGPPAWQELSVLTRRAPALVGGLTAAGVWVPLREPAAVLDVTVRDERRVSPLPQSAHLRVHLVAPLRGGEGWRSAVPVALPNGGRVHVPAPAELLLDPRCRPVGLALRAAARALHQSGGRDGGDRRAPPHRDPDEAGEGQNLSRALTYAMDDRLLPDPADSRGWRLEAPVSLRQWHQAHGHPPRRGSQRP